jgi:hypothetical protein
MAISTTVAADIVYAALDFYVKGKAFAQTIQDKPLLRWLSENQKPFGGGAANIKGPVQGAYMYDTAGFFAGYSESDQLTFAQAANIKQYSYPWKECHAGLIITETELKKDGISVNDSMRASDHAQAEVTRLTGLLENRLDDYGESWSRAKNDMFWKDGSQDSKQVPGIRAILQDAGPGQGTVGGLSCVTYSWWNYRARIGADKVTPSEASQTLTKAIRHDMIQLRRYGGKPNKAFMGSDFWDALMLEVQAKGQYTQTGFTGRNNIGMGVIAVDNLPFEYDPTLDNLGRAKFCYIMDSRRIRLRPMEGEDDKVRSPERPYDYLVFLRSMTWTGALEATQLNCHEVIEVA